MVYTSYDCVLFIASMFAAIYNWHVCRHIYKTICRQKQQHHIITGYAMQQDKASLHSGQIVSKGEGPRTVSYLVCPKLESMWLG